MNKNKKNLSSPLATGGAGVHFEVCIQAGFILLMLSGGYAPFLEFWLIKEIKLQGRISGYATDDIIVFAENKECTKKKKLLGQIKCTIQITQSSESFREVIQAAWNDFNNGDLFTKNRDIIALITGPLTITDQKNVQWLLNQARAVKDSPEFFFHAFFRSTYGAWKCHHDVSQ